MNHTNQPQLPEWFLYDGDGKAVANFIPKVLACQEVFTPAGEKCETFVRLSLNFADGTNVEITVSHSDLDQLNWPELNRRCIFSPNYRNARGYIAIIIRAELCHAPVETVYRLDRAGIFHINDAVIFAAGDRVITRSPTAEATPSFDVGQIPFDLDIDPELTVAKAFEGMGELINLSPEIGRVLVAHAISGIIRAAFKEAGLTPCAVLVVMGKSGMLKSHYVPHMVQLYNRQNGIGAVTRFNSTKRFIEDALYDYSECTAVIDDLHTAESRVEMKKLLKKSSGGSVTILDVDAWMDTPTCSNNFVATPCSSVSTPSGRLLQFPGSWLSRSQAHQMERSSTNISDTIHLLFQPSTTISSNGMLTILLRFVLLLMTVSPSPVKQLQIPAFMGGCVIRSFTCSSPICFS